MIAMLPAVNFLPLCRIGSSSAVPAPFCGVGTRERADLPGDGRSGLYGAPRAIAGHSGARPEPGRNRAGVAKLSRNFALDNRRNRAEDRRERPRSAKTAQPVHPMVEGHHEGVTGHILGIDTDPQDTPIVSFKRCGEVMNPTPEEHIRMAAYHLRAAVKALEIKRRLFDAQQPLAKLRISSMLKECERLSNFMLRMLK